MPTRNRADLIKDVITSITSQTFNDWELLVIDDHGQDNTKKIVDKINDSRIKYFYLDKNLGPGGARDFGIKKAQGDIIVLADSDDINCPKRLELTYQAFQENPEIDVVYGLAVRKEVNNSLFTRPSHPFDPQLLQMYNYIANCATSFKKGVYLKTKGYDRVLNTSEDYDLWLSFLEKDAQFLFIDKPLILQKIHSQSTLLMTEVEQRKDNLSYVRKKHHLTAPDFSEVTKLVKNKKLLEYISTPKAIKFWFNVS